MVFYCSLEGQDRTGATQSNILGCHYWIKELGSASVNAFRMDDFALEGVSSNWGQHIFEISVFTE